MILGSRLQTNLHKKKSWEMERGGLFLHCSSDDVAISVNPSNALSNRTGYYEETKQGGISVGSHT